MLAYKTVSGTKSFKKAVHLTLQSVAFCLSSIGVWAAYKFHNEKGIDNFYSFHSWLGLACLFLFGIQVCSSHPSASILLNGSEFSAEVSSIQCLYEHHLPSANHSFHTKIMKHLSVLAY
jgi:hypothetical protein